MATRQDVIDAVRGRMETILPANGYTSSIGSAVTVHREGPYHYEDTLPALNIRDDEDELLSTLISGPDLYENRRLPVSIDIVVFGGSNSDDDARALVEDVLAAIGADATFGSTVLNVDVSQDRLEVDQAEYKIAGVTMTLEIIYRRKAWGERTVTIPGGTTLSDLAFGSYVATLVQAGGGDPTPTVVGNTLSAAIIWTRSSEGVYLGTLAAAFPAGRVSFPSPNLRPSSGGAYKASLSRVSDNQVRLEVWDPGGSAVDGFTDLNVEIRVYTTA